MKYTYQSPHPSSNKPVFQMYPSRGYVSMDDVRDVRSICKDIPTKIQRDAVYSMYGIDSDGVDKYYSTVESFYNSYHAPSQNNPVDNYTKNIYHKFGPVSIIIQVDI